MERVPQLCTRQYYAIGALPGGEILATFPALTSTSVIAACSVDNLATRSAEQRNDDDELKGVVQ
eukprot:scaffold168090_cov36-Prasinocladus_malaysianus.AAC.1